MVWETIRNIDPLPLLWNAFPFHPFHTGRPESNRVPDASELDLGASFIEMLVRLFSIERVVAIGNQAATSLSRLAISHEKLRHPSMGGKKKFADGMARLSHDAAS
jgi:uracil-DNA glycosylase